MIVLVRIEVDDEERRAIRHQYGQPGLTTRREVSQMVENSFRYAVQEQVDELRTHQAVDAKGGDQ